MEAERGGSRVGERTMELKLGRRVYATGEARSPGEARTSMARTPAQFLDQHSLIPFGHVLMGHLILCKCWVGQVCINSLQDKRLGFRELT
jgi:hypothetical protein